MIHNHLESLYPDISRFEEIEQILNFVKKGQSCQIIAMPGVGRGNLLKFLAYNHNIRVKHLGEKQTMYHFVYINFDEIKHRPVYDSLKFMFLELVSSLHERAMEDAFKTTDKIFKESISYNDELVLFQELKEALDFLTAEKQLHVIFLFERFETYLPMLDSSFFTSLRSLRNKAKYMFSVVFSVTRALEETVEPEILADYYEFFSGNEVYLNLTDDPGIRFRISYLERLTGQNLDKKCVENLLKLTSGHGKLTRLSIEIILGKNTKNPLTCVNSDFLLSQKIILSSLREIWDFLTPSEQEIIFAVSGNAKHQDHDLFLEKIHLINNHSLTIPLFKGYLAAYGEQLQIHSGSFVYDITTNTIKRGDLIISDGLTASELRLFLFLIKNPNKILDREEIINAVWKDTASTSGVTDQALDQLVFRLRKKIEGNPNNPKHIQTIKGRGFSFLP